MLRPRLRLNCWALSQGDEAANSLARGFAGGQRLAMPSDGADTAELLAHGLAMPAPDANLLGTKRGQGAGQSRGSLCRRRAWAFAAGPADEYREGSRPKPWQAQDFTGVYRLAYKITDMIPRLSPAGRFCVAERDVPQKLR